MFRYLLKPPDPFIPRTPNFKFFVYPSSSYSHRTSTFRYYKPSTEILHAVMFLQVFYSKYFNPQFPSSFLDSVCFLFLLSPVYLIPVANKTSLIHLSDGIGGFLCVGFLCSSVFPKVTQHPLRHTSNTSTQGRVDVRCDVQVVKYRRPIAVVHAV